LTLNEIKKKTTRWLSEKRSRDPIKKKLQKIKCPEKAEKFVEKEGDAKKWELNPNHVYEVRDTGYGTVIRDQMEKKSNIPCVTTFSGRGAVLTSQNREVGIKGE